MIIWIIKYKVINVAEKKNTKLSWVYVCVISQADYNYIGKYLFNDILKKSMLNITKIF